MVAEQEESEVVAVQESKISSNKRNLHVVFIPLLAHGHQIPLFDIARLFAAKEGVIATLVTTPGNASVFNNDHKPPDINIITTNNIVNIEVIPFPGEEVGLPPGFENFENAGDDETFMKFFQAVGLLQDPFEAVVARIKPNCLISDMFLPWTLDVATKFGIPRLVFHGSSFFSMSASEVIRNENPFKQNLGVGDDDDHEYVIPGLPDRITLLKSQIMPESLKGYWEKNPGMKLIMDSFDAEKKSYGVVMNSFYELESKYADYYRDVMGRRAWAIGPVSLRNRTTADKASRGKKAAINQQECLQWLDSKPPNSVIYVSFGSIVAMCPAQLRQIATALEASDQNFIWTVRKTDQQQQQQESDDDHWLPDPDFEERNREKGLIIRGWAPQVLILDHQSTGGFMTHCGWNSTLEGIAAGVPMLTWPIFADQFLNEKLLTQIVKTGIPVGSKKYWNRVVSEVTVRSEAIEKAIRRLMVGNEADDIRRKAQELKQLAYRALEKGGSSYQGLSDLLNEINSFSATINE